MPRPPARRKQFAPASVRDQPVRVTKAHNERNITDLAGKLRDKPVGRVPNNSDDSDELVTKATNARNRRGVARREVFASGGLGKGDEPATRQHRKRTSDTLKDLNEDQGEPAGKKQKHEKEEKGTAPLVRNGRLAKAPTAPVAINGGKTRSYKPPVVKATLSGSELSHANGLRDHSPPAVERSILADIKRRPRQASILSNAKVPGDDSLDDLTDFDDLDDLDNLEPNDESTPIDSRTRTFHHPNTLRPSSRAPIRHGSNIPPTPSVLPRNQASGGISTTENPESQHRQRSASPLRPVQSPSQTREESDTYGPPLSSSPLRSSPQRSPQHKQPSPRQGSHDLRLPATTNATDTRKGTSPQKQVKAPSTQSLQNLMPQPRRKPRQLRQKADKDDFEIPSDTPSHSSPNPPSPTNGSSFLGASQLRKQRTTSRKFAATTGGKPARRKTGKDPTTVAPTKRRGKPAQAKSGGAITQRKGQIRRKSTTPPPANFSSLLSPSPPPQQTPQSAAKNTQRPRQRRQRRLPPPPSRRPLEPQKSNSSRLHPGSNDENKENRPHPGTTDDDSSSSSGPGDNAVLPSTNTITSSSPPEPGQEPETEQAPPAARRKYGGSRRNDEGGRESKVKGGGGGMGWGKKLDGLDDQLSAVRRKFEDVDGWGLEFEDVSGSGGAGGSREGSSPTRRWR
ncbi:MAG: hypothetical protein Q9160_003707 [Pyrenula sp. 1 TL-2023]